MKLPTSLLAASAVAAVATGALADELVIGTRNETTSIDPHFYNTSSNHQVVAHVFEYLVIKDNRQRLKPGLAESWRPVDDTTWEFKLRKDVRLSDGTPFTADDFMYNVERSTSGDLKLPAPSTRYMLGKTYKKIDDYTIHVSAGKPYPLMPNDMSVSPLVSAKYGKGAKTEDYNSGKATIGSGPYKFVEWVPGDRVVLEPNPNYWGAEKAKWDKITYKVIKSDPSRLAALLNRDVDLIDYVPTTDVKRLANEPKVALTRIESNRVIYLHLDQWRDVSPYVKKNDGSDFDHNPLRKVKVRLALSMAINRPAIVDRVMDGAAKPAGQLPVDGMFGFNPALTPHAYDPEGAKKLLAEAGYPDGFRITVHGPNDRYVNDGKIVEDRRRHAGPGRHQGRGPYPAQVHLLRPGEGLQLRPGGIRLGHRRGVIGLHQPAAHARSRQEPGPGEPGPLLQRPVRQADSRGTFGTGRQEAREEPDGRGEDFLRRGRPDSAPLPDERVGAPPGPHLRGPHGRAYLRLQGRQEDVELRPYAKIGGRPREGPPVPFFVGQMSAVPGSSTFFASAKAGPPG